MVYSNDTIANFVKSAGALAINGVQYAPDLDLMQRLDPGGANAQV
ncbi:MAG: hypothetical protein U0514_04380 [Candidatus Andersenbacteria bacterium]